MYPCQVPPSVDKEDIVYSPGFLEEKISNKTLFVFYSFICLVISDLIYPFWEQKDTEESKPHIGTVTTQHS